MKNITGILTPILGILILKLALYVGLITKPESNFQVNINIDTTELVKVLKENNEKTEVTKLILTEDKDFKSQTIKIEGKLYKLEKNNDKFFVNKIEKENFFQFRWHELNGDNILKWIYYLRLLLFIIAFFLFIEDLGTFLSFLLVSVFAILYSILASIIITDLGLVGWNGAIVFSLIFLIDTIIGARNGAKNSMM